MIDPQQTVASVVTQHSECAQIFQQHRIDFCCRGDLSIQNAAQERGVELPALLSLLEQAIAERRPQTPGVPVDLPNLELIELIVEKHHAYLRRVLPFLVPLAAKVGRVHGDHNPKLRALNEAVKALAEALIPHLDDEEKSLFPAMLAAGGAATPALDSALSAMQTEHLAVAELLSKIRNASDEFMLPDWACGSYRTLFGELQTMEADIFRHVHLENHVLAPRFRSSEPSLSLIDLKKEAATLVESDPYRTQGHSASTLLKKEDARVVLLALRGGAHIQKHKTDHTIAVQTLTGCIQFTSPTKELEVPAGAMVFLKAGVPHALTAKEDSSVLLTIHWKNP